MKKIFTLIVALMAIATSAYSFVLEVNGYSVTAANGHNIPYDGIDFDAPTMTLTITNLESSINGACIYAADFGTDELKIVVNGTCTLNSSEEVLGIKNSNVTITGPGKLSLKSSGKEAISVGSNSKLVFSDADVQAEGYWVIKGASGAVDNYVVVDHSRFDGTNTYSYQPSVEGLADLTLNYAEFTDVSFPFEEEYNAPCTFYGKSFCFDTTTGSLRYNGQYLNEDYDTTAPYNAVWYHDFGIAPTERKPEAYAMYKESTNTLTFYYDDQKGEKAGEYYFINDSETGWLFKDVVKEVKNVVFDPSFAEYLPKSTAHWFEGMTLYNITDIRYLNTKEVANMGYMFNGFGFTSDFTELNLMDFDTHNVTDMRYMFNGCKLKVIDLSTFDTRQVQFMTAMFYGCPNLETIYVGDDWSTAALTTNGKKELFTNCPNLKGGNGTTYDNGHRDADYAHADESGNPGYMTFNEVFPLWVLGNRVTDRNHDCIYWTSLMSQLPDAYVRYDKDTKTLRICHIDLNNPPSEGFIRGNESLVANGKADPLNWIRGIDGLNIILNHTAVGRYKGSYSQSTPNDLKMAFDIAGNTTLLGKDFYFIGNEGPAIRVCSKKTLSIEDHIGEMILVAPQTVIEGTGSNYESKLNISHSSLRLHQLNGTVGGLQGETIGWMGSINFEGIVFEDIPYETLSTPGTVAWTSGVQGDLFGLNPDGNSIWYDGGSYGDAIWMKKDTSEDVVKDIVNGQERTSSLRFFIGLFTDEYGYCKAPVLTTQEQEGKVYYVRKSDNKSLFYYDTSNQTMTVLPGAENVSMPASNVADLYFDELYRDGSLEEILEEKEWFRGENLVLHMGKSIPTAITPPQVPNNAVRQTYSLSGQRIEGQPMHKGVYIVNGHKVVIK